VKRFLAPLILVLALALPVQAVAGSKKYSGAVTPSGTVSFKIKKKKHGKKKVRGVHFNNVPITCDEGTGTTTANLGNAGRLKDKQFAVHADNGAGATLDTAGAVAGKSASGRVLIQGKVPLDSGGTGTNCDTDVLDWTASR
jgi:hypothetical protein